MRHATAPVDFVSALRACEADVFLQVGAGGALLSFARGVGQGSFLSLAPADGGDAGAMLLSTLGQLFVRGVALKLSPLTAGRAQLVPLPPSPLETQTYWPVERPAQRAPRATLARAGSTALTARPGVPMENLVALFREQMALMQSQAEILRAQAAALQAMAGGDPAALAQLQAAPAPMPAPAALPAQQVVARPPNFSNLVATKPGAAPAPAPAAAPAPAVAPAVDATAVRSAVETKLLHSVARISAFPFDTLKLEQTLVGELGFDSLMLVELDQDIAKGWPQLGGLPRDLFNKNTTVGHLVDHVVQVLSKGSAGPAAAKAESQQAPRLFAPAAEPAPLTALREAAPRHEGTLRVTPDDAGLAQALVAELHARGVKAELAAAGAPGDFSGVVQLSPRHRRLPPGDEGGARAGQAPGRLARALRHRHRAGRRASASTAWRPRSWARWARRPSPARSRRSGPTRW